MTVSVTSAAAEGDLAETIKATPDIDASIARISMRLGNVTASDFLTECANAMHDELHADYFLIARLNPFANIMRTLCFIGKDGMMDNAIYSLDGTPCANTLREGICIHTDNVARDYPQDKDLVDLNVASYAGASLKTPSGETIGVMVALWEAPLRHRKHVLDLLTHFRRRIGSVIDTTERAARYSWAIAKLFGGVWEWDLRTGGTVLSEGLENLLGAGPNGKGPYDLAQIEDAIHPEDRSKHVDALKRHLNDGVPYDISLRLRGPDGVYRWCASRGAAVRDADGKPERMIGGFCDIHDIVVKLEKTGSA